jgi:cytochrome c
MEGAAYTDKKNVQPTSWGTSYFADSTRPFKWIVETEGKKDSFRILNKGYAFLHNQIYLKFILIPSSKDTIHIEERPEFVQSKGKPAFERLFKTSGVPGNITISLQSGDTTFHLESNKTCRFIVHLKQLPEQFPPKQQEEYDHRGRYFMEKSDCFTCHELDQKTVGPSLHQIAQRYQDENKTVDQLINKVRQGGTGVWGSALMNPHPFSVNLK